MNAFADSLLSNVDILSRRLAPINALIGLVADRITLKNVARACHGAGTICDEYCSWTESCCGNCIGWRARVKEVNAYVPGHPECSYVAICETCTSSCGNCNGC
jgi:hypothetical protein